MRFRRSTVTDDGATRPPASGASRPGTPRPAKKGDKSAPDPGGRVGADPAEGGPGGATSATDAPSEAAAPAPGRHNRVVAVVGGLGLAALAAVAYYFSISPIPAVVVLVLTGVFVAAEVVEMMSGDAAVAADGRPASDPGAVGPGVPPPASEMPGGVDHAFRPTGPARPAGPYPPEASFAPESPYPPEASFAPESPYPPAPRPAPLSPPPGPDSEPRAVTSPLFRQDPDHRPPVIAEPPAPAVSRISGYGAYGSGSHGQGARHSRVTGPGSAAVDNTPSTLPSEVVVRHYRGRPVSTVTGYGAYGGAPPVADGPGTDPAVEDTDPDATIVRGVGRGHRRREEP